MFKGINKVLDWIWECVVKASKKMWRKLFGKKPRRVQRGNRGTRNRARSEPEADTAEKGARSRASLADPLLSNADNAVSSSSNQNENLSFPWPCLVWEEQDNTNWFTIQLAVIVEDGCLKFHKMAVWHDVEKDEVREAITRGSEFIKEQFSSEESASEELKDG